jgi:hypothetical protein
MREPFEGPRCLTGAGALQLVSVLASGPRVLRTARQRAFFPRLRPRRRAGGFSGIFAVSAAGPGARAPPPESLMHTPVHG